MLPVTETSAFSPFPLTEYRPSLPRSAGFPLARLLWGLLVYDACHSRGFVQVK